MSSTFLSHHESTAPNATATPLLNPIPGARRQCVLLVMEIATKPPADELEPQIYVQQQGCKNQVVAKGLCAAGCVPL